MAGEAASNRNNFTFEAPRPVGRLRSFTRRSRYRPVSGLKSSKDQLGSNSSLNSLSGRSEFILCFWVNYLMPLPFTIIPWPTGWVTRLSEIMSNEKRDVSAHFFLTQLNYSHQPSLATHWWMLVPVYCVILFLNSPQAWRVPVVFSIEIFLKSHHHRQRTGP